MVSFLSGLVDIMAIRQPTISSKASIYSIALAGSSLNSRTPLRSVPTLKSFIDSLSLLQIVRYIIYLFSIYLIGYTHLNSSNPSSTSSFISAIWSTPFIRTAWLSATGSNNHICGGRPCGSCQTHSIPFEVRPPSFPLNFLGKGLSHTGCRRVWDSWDLTIFWIFPILNCPPVG